MHYGKCKFVEERHLLLDKAKIIYAQKVQEASSAQPFIAGCELSEQSVQAYRRDGHCDLRRRLPVSVLSAQKAYLDEKLKIENRQDSKQTPHRWLKI